MLCRWSRRAPSEPAPPPQLPDGSAMFPAIEQPPSPNPHNHHLKFHWDKGCFRKAATWLQSCGVPAGSCPQPHCSPGTGVSAGWGQPQTQAPRAALLWGSSGGWSNMNSHFLPVSIKFVGTQFSWRASPARLWGWSQPKGPRHCTCTGPASGFSRNQMKTSHGLCQGASRIGLGNHSGFLRH